MWFKVLTTTLKWVFWHKRDENQFRGWALAVLESKGIVLTPFVLNSTAFPIKKKMLQRVASYLFVKHEARFQKRCPRAAPYSKQYIFCKFLSINFLGMGFRGWCGSLVNKKRYKVQNGTPLFKNLTNIHENQFRDWLSLGSVSMEDESSPNFFQTLPTLTRLTDFRTKRLEVRKYTCEFLVQFCELLWIISRM